MRFKEIMVTKPLYKIGQTVEYFNTYGGSHSNNGKVVLIERVKYLEKEKIYFYNGEYYECNLRVPPNRGLRLATKVVF